MSKASELIVAAAREQIGETNGLKTDAALKLCADHIEEQARTIQRLQGEVYVQQKMMREMQRPQPFTLGEVLGYKNGHFYALQLRNVFNEYPKVRVEVYLP